MIQIMIFKNLNTYRYIIYLYDISLIVNLIMGNKHSKKKWGDKKYSQSDDLCLINKSIYEKIKNCDIEGFLNNIQHNPSLVGYHYKVPMIHWIAIYALIHPHEEYIELIKTVSQYIHHLDKDITNTPIHLNLVIMKNKTLIFINGLNDQNKEISNYLCINSFNIDNLCTFIDNKICKVIDVPYIEKRNITDDIFRDYKNNVTNNIKCVLNYIDTFKPQEQWIDINPEVTDFNQSPLPQSDTAIEIHNHLSNMDITPDRKQPLYVNPIEINYITL